MGIQNDLTDLAGRIERCAARGQANGYTAYVLVAIGVLASASATISVAAGALTPTTNAVLAALPGIVVMILRSFKFEQRSKWWREKHHGLLKLQARLKPDGSNAEDIRIQVADFLSEHYAKWPGFEFDKPPK